MPNEALVKVGAETLGSLADLDLVARREDQRRDNPSIMRIRRGTPSDIAFLAQMLVEAVNWDPQRQPLPGEEILERRETAHYLVGWGRAGDTAVIAEDDGGASMGAAWFRFFPATEPAYGFIDETIPELAMGVVARFRGVGVGGRLLEALEVEAKCLGVGALSLSVERGNARAVHLYRRHGFEVVCDAGGSHVMRLNLSPGAANGR